MAVGEGGGKKGKVGRQAQACAVIDGGSGGASKMGKGSGEMVRWMRQTMACRRGCACMMEGECGGDNDMGGG